MGYKEYLYVDISWDIGTQFGRVLLIQLAYICLIVGAFAFPTVLEEFVSFAQKKTSTYFFL